jgi:hypothetical protein
VSMQAAAWAAGVIGLVSLLFGPSIFTVLEYLPPRLGLVPWLVAVVGCGVVGAVIALAVESRRLGAAPPGAGDRAIAIAVTAGYLGLVVVLDRLLRTYLPIDGLAVAGATAIAVDLIAEVALRAREGRVVAIASLQAVVDADRACAALADAGIPVACQGLAYRALMRVFAPFVPLDVLVPAELADRAREIVSAATADAR